MDNPNQGVERLYTKDYKTLLKEIKDQNKWKDTLCSQVETSYYLKWSADSMQSLSKFQHPFFAEI